MNLYANLSQIKSPGWLNIQDTTKDADLLRLLEDSSRFVDDITNRFFYCWEGTRYFDGADRTLSRMDDVLSISSLYVDMDASQTYASLVSSTDYASYPLNKYPTTYLKLRNSST